MNTAVKHESHKPQPHKPLRAVELRALSQIEPGRAELRILFELAFIFVLIAAHAWAFIPFWTLPVVLIIIASRQHALLVLMHEGAHRRISKHVFWNDLIAELIAWNFLAFMHGYRRHHHAHHNIENLNGPRDPDWARKQNAQWVFPMKVSDFLRMLARDVLLLNTRDYFQEAKDAKNNQINTRAEAYWMSARLVYMCTLIVVLIATGYWKLWLLYWLLPLLTFLKAIFRIRSIADHFCVKGGHALSQTRTVMSSTWDRLLIGPCSIGIHGPHHLYPSIPYYNLREAHHKLMADAVYSRHAHVTHGYHRAIGECLALSPKEAR